MADKWARWWLWLWGAVATGLLAAVFLIEFKWWAICAAIGFGVMEGVGLLRPHDPYPPLTQVIHKFVPRWVAFTAIYGFVGAAGGVWFKFPRPYRLAAIFALLGWLTTHFDTTFSERKTLEERSKYRRIVRMLPGGGKSVPD
jgi:hypothetical protein